jgi:hypothetical protein
VIQQNDMARLRVHATYAPRLLTYLRPYNLPQFKKVDLISVPDDIVPLNKANVVSFTYVVHVYRLRTIDSRERAGWAYSHLISRK